MPPTSSQVSTAGNGNRDPPYAGARDAHRRRREIHHVLHDSLMKNLLNLAIILFLFLGWAKAQEQSLPVPQPRVIELTADKDSRYRQNGKGVTTIEAVAGEPLILRVAAVPAKQTARDGSVHGLALLDKQSNVVPGWRFFFQPGTQEVRVTAPAKPGRYIAVCTVICSEGHEGMTFTLVIRDDKKVRKD